MALSWCKVASNLDSHPKIRKAGRDGREVFLFALRRNAEPGNKHPGSISADELEPDYLAYELMSPRDAVVTGVTAAVTAGLLALEGDRYVIVGWEEDWSKAKSDGAKRTEKWRKNKELPKQPSRGDRPRHTVTLGDTSDIEETRSEETRSDQKRERGAREFDPNEPTHIGALAKAIWPRLSALRVSLAAELGIPDVSPLTELGLAEPRGFRDLRARIREEGRQAPSVCERVLASLAAEARRTRSVEWVSEKATTEGAWRTAKERTAGATKRTPSDGLQAVLDIANGDSQ